MSRFTLLLILICSILLISGSPAYQKETAQPTVIRAAEYASLQAALDAIPTTGGELRLAPGTIEIEKPLQLNRGDVRIIGAGTSSRGYVQQLRTNLAAWKPGHRLRTAIQREIPLVRSSRFAGFGGHGQRTEITGLTIAW